MQGHAASRSVDVFIMGSMTRHMLQEGHP